MPRFGVFRLRGRLAQGGLCDIYRAHRVGPGGLTRDIALKRLRTEQVGDARRAEMLVEEGRLGAQLIHPAIIRTEDLVVVEDVWAVVLEFIDGLDLRRLRRVLGRQQRRLRWQLVALIAQRTLAALAYLHDRHGLVHQDITPANLMLNTDGELKLIDFGQLALSRLRPKHAVGGTLRYLPPEALAGRPLDAKSDLFAAGLVIWELLTGLRLHDPLKGSDLEAAVARAEIPPLSDHTVDGPPEFHELVSWMIEPHPLRRPPSASLLLARLEALCPPNTHLHEQLAKTATAAQAELRSTDLPVVIPEPSLEERLEAELSQPPQNADTISDIPDLPDTLQ